MKVSGGILLVRFGTLHAGIIVGHAWENVYIELSTSRRSELEVTSKRVRLSEETRHLYSVPNVSIHRPEPLLHAWCQFRPFPISSRVLDPCAWFEYCPVFQQVKAENKQC